LDEAPRQEELRGERRHREIEALDAQRRQAKQNADRRREEARRDHPDDDVDAGEIGRELVAGIGPHPHEGAGAERQESRIAGEQIEADRGERKNQKRNHHCLNQEAAAEIRDDNRGDEDDDGDADAVLPQREHRKVRGVGRLVLASLAVKHD
jgi:hypothetical protein